MDWSVKHTVESQWFYGFNRSAFSDRASPVGFAGPKRVTPTPFQIKDLPVIDVVLISHNHYDHLDRASIEDLIAYQPSIKFFVPLGLAKTLMGWGAKDVTELDWW